MGDSRLNLAFFSAFILQTAASFLHLFLFCKQK